MSSCTSFVEGFSLPVCKTRLKKLFREHAYMIDLAHLLRTCEGLSKYKVTTPPPNDVSWKDFFKKWHELLGNIFQQICMCRTDPFICLLLKCQNFIKFQNLTGNWIPIPPSALTSCSLGSLVLHEAWAGWDFILQNDYVTLHGCDETHVWFCVTDKEVDVYLPSTGPFVFANQYFLAKKLVIVKWDLLHKIAGKTNNFTAQNLRW